MNATQKAAKFIIRAKYFYYSTTYNAPKDGALIEPWSENRMIFGSKESAESHLITQMELSRNQDGSWSRAGTYLTKHGEYARPIYLIRKLPR